MDNFKIKLSDIFKYILLGLVEAAIVIAVIGTEKITPTARKLLNQEGEAYVHRDTTIAVARQDTTFTYTLSQADTSQSEIIEASKTIALTVIPIATIVLLYIVGYLTQSIILLIYGGRFLGTGITEVAQFIRHNPRWISRKDKYPDWIHWSDNPGKVIDTYKEHLEASESSGQNAEYLYSNQLFQGVTFALTVAGLYSSSEGCIWVPLSALVLIYIFNKINWTPLPYIWALIICGGMAAMGIFMGPSDCWGWSLCLVLAVIFAVQLAKTQIIRLGIIAKDTDDRLFDRILRRFGQPKAYILIRAHQKQFLEETLASVANQDYPNIKVLLLIDKDSGEYDKIVNIAETFRTGERKLNISWSKAKTSQAAALAHEIRGIYLKSANDDDIAIMLDSDDLFYSPYSVSRIMTKMYKTKSDICLLAFETFGENALNYAKNGHNELVKEVARERRSWTPKQLDAEKRIHRISTIGWTKCYNKKTVKYYYDALSEYASKFSEYTQYEDFPDIINILKKDVRICAVEKTSIMFRKHKGSVTTTVTCDKYYKFIPYFLNLCRLLTLNDKGKEKDSKFISSALEIVVERLIPYKITQYYHVLLKDEKIREELMKQKRMIKNPEIKFCKYIFRIYKDKIEKYLNSDDFLSKDFDILEIDVKCEELRKDLKLSPYEDDTKSSGDNKQKFRAIKLGKICRACRELLQRIKERRKNHNFRAR